MASELTERQRQVLAFIADHILRHGYPPTMRSMCDHLGIASTNGISDHLRALHRKGYVKPTADAASRTITIARWPAIDVSAYGEGTFLHGLLEALGVEFETTLDELVEECVEIAERIEGILDVEVAFAREKP